MLTLLLWLLRGSFQAKVQGEHPAGKVCDSAERSRQLEFTGQSTKVERAAHRKNSREFPAEGLPQVFNKKLISSWV